MKPIFPTHQGMICISPTAPAPLRAFGFQALSVWMIPKTTLAGIPALAAAARAAASRSCLSINGHCPRWSAWGKGFFSAIGYSGLNFQVSIFHLFTIRLSVKW